jgi:protein subunit release factor B
VKCQDTRSRDQNRKTARRILIDKLDALENGDESRVALKAAAKAKKKASKTKKAKRKYRKEGDAEGAVTEGIGIVSGEDNGSKGVVEHDTSGLTKGQSTGSGG